MSNVTEALDAMKRVAERLSKAASDRTYRSQSDRLCGLVSDCAADLGAYHSLAMQSKATPSVEWSEQERAAIRRIGEDQELSDRAVLRQALRHYQQAHERLRAGETVKWSGDEQRAKDFAGPCGKATPSVDVEHGSQCSDYLTACPKCIEGFRQWKDNHAAIKAISKGGGE